MREADVEKIVREVLERLRAESAKGAVSADIGSGQKYESIAGELALTESLVTLATLDGRLMGLKRLVVRPRTVLTPAVKDLLRERLVEVVFQSGGAGRETATLNGKPRLMLALAATNYEPSALARNLKQERLEVEQLADTGLKSMLDELSAGVARGGRRGWLLTGEAPAAVCLANRKAGLRAAAAASAAEVRSALGSAGANLLVTDPAGKSYWELWRIGLAFARGASECPAWLEEHLR